MTATNRTEDRALQPAEELARRAQAGSREDFTELANRFGPRLFHYFRQRVRCREDCEDLVQETLVKAFRNIDRYRPAQVFSTWLYTIGTRLQIDFLRARGRRRTAVDPGLAAIPAPVPAENPFEAAARRDDTRSLWVLARSLPEKQRAALWLRYGEGLTVKEIARVLGLTRVHVKVLLFRARAGLVKMSDRKRPAPAAAMESGELRRAMSCR